MQHEVLQGRETEQKVRAEWRRLSGERDLRLEAGIAWRELTPLVELPVVGQVGLRHDAEQPPLADEGAAVIEEPVDRDRQTDEGRDRQPARGGEQFAQRVLRRLQQRSLVKQVVACVGREAKLGEHREHRLLACRAAHQLDGRVEIRRRVADTDARGGEGHAREVVAVKAQKVAHGRHFTPSVLWCSMPYTEQVVLPSGRFTVFLDGSVYRLSYKDLVIYENGKRIVRGRSSAYAFRSVEQMRYDFERDVEAL